VMGAGVVAKRAICRALGRQAGRCGTGGGFFCASWVLRIWARGCALAPRLAHGGGEKVGNSSGNEGYFLIFVLEGVARKTTFCATADLEAGVGLLARRDAALRAVRPVSATDFTDCPARDRN